MTAPAGATAGVWFPSGRSDTVRDHVGASVAATRRRRNTRERVSVRHRGGHQLAQHTLEVIESHAGNRRREPLQQVRWDTRIASGLPGSPPSAMGATLPALGNRRGGHRADGGRKALRSLS